MIFKPDIPENLQKYDNAHFVVIPSPYEKTTSYGHGTKNGPSSICEASLHVELYDEEIGKETYHKGISTLNSIDDLNELEKTTEKVVADKKIPIILGGEHTVSAFPIRACHKHYKNLSVVHFDAHADLRNEYEGTKLSHACVMRRVVEEGIEVVQIGIRSHSLEEAEFIKNAKLHRPFYAHEIYNSDLWMDRTLKILSDNVYLSFDVDVFDASIMPSTGTPEPGGMNWFQVVEFFKKLAKAKNVVGADFVELAPVKNNPSPDFAIAKLIYKFIGYAS